MKKAVSIILIALLGVSLFVPMANAATAKATIALSSSSVTIGNTVKVTVKYTADEAIGTWDFKLNYDKEYLEYVNGADSGGSGVLNFCSWSESENQKTISQTVTFKTRKIGSTTVSTSTSAIVSNSTISKMNASNASASITIKAKPEASTNANLSSLKVSPGTLSPEFSASTTDYKMTVDYSVTNLAVSAITAHSAATKSLSSTALSVGENKITLTVTAESGAKKTYTINVTRGVSPLADLTIMIDAVSYKVAYESGQLKPPSDKFTETTAKYENETLPAYKAPNDLFMLVCLISPSDEKIWFMYDEQTSTFTRYINIKPLAKEYILLDMPQNEVSPKGYELKNVAISEKEFVNAFIKEGSESELIIVYAMTIEGDKGLYYYHIKDKAFMRVEPNDDDSKDVLAFGMTYEELANKLMKAEKDLQTSQILMLAIAALFSVLLVLSVVYAINSRKKRKQEENM
ncbi:MAG TPA: cadherin-like beta sandwich domain-containing protein [Oscillospiraceae bacterium]|nr:cadherin-like beta sandwich domain-containing protein [Oscillospiraceae bacterium]